MAELSTWEYGAKGKAAALFVEKKGEIFTAMHDPITDKFWNLYTKQGDPLSIATVFGSAGGDKSMASGSIREQVFEDEEQRDAWIEKTVKQKEKKGYKEVEDADALTVADVENAKECEG